jgi:TRAP-type transport system periplasmic protein
MFRKLATMMFAAGVVVSAASTAQAAEVTVKVGTLAPAASPWGEVFKLWQRGLKARTADKMEVEFFWNGQQGDEIAMAGKIRNGQLDGAAMTATGLSQFSKSVLALQLPGFSGGDWSKVDRAREALKPIVEAEFASQKVVLLGTGDVGLGHIMSVGAPVKVPGDMKALNPSFFPNDILGRSFLTKLGVPLQQVSVPEMLPKLGGAVKVLNTSALAAEQLQWASKLTHMNSMVTGAGVGGLIFSADKLNALPADLKDALVETGRVAGQALTGRIRREDAAAYDRLKRKLEVYDNTAADTAAWQGMFAQVRTDVCGPVIKAEACALAR